MLTTPNRSAPLAALCLCAAVSLCAAVACAPRADESESAPSKEASPLRLYVMDCGRLTLGDVSFFNLSAEEAGTDELAVPCYLIEHAEGRLLWDLGLPLTVRTGEYEMEGSELSLERSVVEQLADLDLTPSDIDFLAMSHLHFDHCGQAADFADAHHLIQRAEYEAAFTETVEVPGFERQWYQALAESETTLLEGDHDVFGDGRVVIKSAPGHTPGHQTLFVDLEETGPILLSGDLYHFEANRTLRRPPLFNVDSEQTLTTMAATETFLEESGATLWIEHSAALADSQKKLPAYYR